MSIKTVKSKKKSTVTVINPNAGNGRMFKRLFFDLETSFNIVASWNIGYDINIDHNSIIRERAVICVCYKWQHEDVVHYLKWDNGDDKEMLKKFIAIINTADECIAHNGDRYDIKWLRTRCLYHGIPAFPQYSTVDTLKLSRSGFNFNSNKLDYIAKFLGVGSKIKTRGFDMWKEIILDNNPESMKEMVHYCKGDVLILEKVFHKLNPYSKHKIHVGVLKGGKKCDCPECASSKVQRRGFMVLASGAKKIRLQCQECGKYFSVAEKELV